MSSQGGLSIELLGGGSFDRRLGVADSARLSLFIELIEEGEELVVLALRERVELVIVTAGTTQRQAHQDRRRRVNAIGDVLDAVLLGDDASFRIDDVVAVEAGRDSLVERRVRQQVSRKLLGDKLIERHPAVEGVDRPVSPPPHVPSRVVVEAVRVGVTGRIEPVERHPFTVARRSQQPINHLLVGIGHSVGEKLIHVTDRRRNTRQIERGSTDEPLLLGRRRRCKALTHESREDKVVDRIEGPLGTLRRMGTLARPVFRLTRMDGQECPSYGRNHWPLRRDERPVRLVLGPLLDPALEQFDLPSRQRLAAVHWRHLFARVSGPDPASQLTLTELPRHEGDATRSQLRLGVFGHIQPQPRLSCLLIRPMTGKTIVRQDRPDVAIEFNGLVGSEHHE